MTAKTLSLPAEKTSTLYRTAGILLLIESLLIFLPMAIMGAAFNWPENLSQPAAINLSIVIEQAGAVQSGYLTYLAYSILFYIVIQFAAQVVAGGEKYGIALYLATGFAALSALSRSIGIARWLSVMPVLAESYANATPEGQVMISVLYDAINAYGGFIGEFLGVSLFAGLAMLALAVAMFRAKKMPKWLAYFGLIASVTVILQTLEIFGLNLNGVIMIAFLQFWMMAAGIVFLGKAKVKI